MSAEGIRIGPKIARHRPDSYHQPFVGSAAQVVATSVAFGWRYAKSGGSLLLVMLMHSAINNSKGIVVSAASVPPGVFSLNAPLVASLGLGVLWTSAAYFLAQMPGKLELRQVSDAGAQGESVRH